jgi:hypothetical protein
MFHQLMPKLTIGVFFSAASVLRSIEASQRGHFER